MADWRPATSEMIHSPGKGRKKGRKGQETLGNMNITPAETGKGRTAQNEQAVRKEEWVRGM